jgi:hypothetical protein
MDKVFVVKTERANGEGGKFITVSASEAGYIVKTLDIGDKVTITAETLDFAKDFVNS